MAALLARGWRFDQFTLAEQIGIEELPTDKELEDKLIKIDIREYGLPIIEDIAPDATYIPREIILEVKRFKNVSVPESSARSAAFDNSGKYILRYYLTDGHKTISGVSIEGDIKINKGAKVLFHKGCVIESGIIIMDKKDLVILGGGIVENKLYNVEQTQAVRDAPKFKELMKAGNKSKANTSRPQQLQVEKVETVTQTTNYESIEKTTRGNDKKSEQNLRCGRQNSSRGRQQEYSTSRGKNYDNERFDGHFEERQNTYERSFQNMRGGSSRQENRNEKNTYNNREERTKQDKRKDIRKQDDLSNIAELNLLETAKKMVYDEYEYGLSNKTLTFNRSSDPRSESGSGKQSETNQRSQNIRSSEGYSEETTSSRRGSSRGGRGGNGSQRGYHEEFRGNRGRGSRGRQQPRGNRNEAPKQYYAQPAYLSSMPQYNPMSDVDFPSL